MLFSGSLGAMQVAPGPNVHEVVLRSPEGVLEGAEFPLVFDHVREPSPPIWYKL
jgi:hypothetical protein